MKGKENECAAVRLGKSRLMVAMAILAVAFVVLAAAPAALTDDGVAGADPATVILTPTDGVTYKSSDGSTTLTGSTTVTSGGNLTIQIVVDAGYEGTPKAYVDGDEVDPTAPDSSPYTFTDIISSATAGHVYIIKITDVTPIKYNEKYEYGDIETGTYSETQIVIIDKESRIVSGTVDVQGKLYVPEGVTLTVKAGATLTAAIADIDGSLVIEKTGTANLTNTDIAGSVQADGSLTMKATSVLTGAMTIGKNGGIQGDITVGESGVLTINGEVADALNITNLGTAIFDSKVAATGATTVKMNAWGAVLKIEEFANADTSSQGITVTDEGTKLPAYKSIGASTVASGGAGTIALSITTAAGETGIISGIEVEQYFALHTSKGYFSELEVSGEVQFSAVGSTATTAVADTTKADITLGGNSATMEITEDLTIGAGVSLTVNGPQLFVFAGLDVSAPKEDADDETTYQSKAASGFTISNGYVSLYNDGVIVSNAKIDGKISAVEYSIENDEGVTTWYYMHIEAALDIVNQDGNTITELNAKGTLYLSNDNEIPAGVTLTVENSLTIASGAELTVVDGAELSVSGGVVSVIGILYAEDGEDVTTDVTADVITEASGSTETWKRWTGLRTALAEAGVGDIVTASKSITVSGSDLVIPEGVLLVFNGANQMTISNGVTVTVNGVLKSDKTIDGTFAAEAGTNKCAMMLNGYIFTKETFAYSTCKVPGAYYVCNDDGVPYNGISSMNNAVLIQEYLVTGITVYGEVSEDVSLTGSTYCSTIEINSGATLKGTITLENATLSCSGSFNGTVVADDTVITVKGKSMTIVHSEDGGLAMAAKSGSGAEIGVVSGTLTAGLATGDNNNALRVSSLTVAEGAVLNAFNLRMDGTITIDGILEVPKSGYMTKGSSSEPTLNLTGSAIVSINEKAREAKVNVLNAGADANGLFDDSEVTVSGKIAIVTNIYAAATATIDPETIEGLDSTSYYVGGEKFLTVYDASATNTAIDSIEYAPVENAYFSGTWLDADGQKATGNVGDKDAVYADLAYDIYEITIKVQTGITDVLLNGQLMDKDGQEFTATVIAGKYTVTAKLASGYTGDVVLTIGGEKVGSNVIVASGIPASGEETVAIDGQLTLATPVTPDTYVVVFDKELVEVTADGEGISSFDSIEEGAVIAIALVDGVEGKILVDGEEYDGEFALAGNIQITVESEPGPLSPSENMIVSIMSMDDGSIYVIATALDGGYIPAGTITVKVNYCIYDEDFGTYVYDSDEVTVTFDGSDESYDFQIVDLTGAQHVSAANSVKAFLTAGDIETSSSVTAFSYTEA